MMKMTIKLSLVIHNSLYFAFPRGKLVNTNFIYG